MEVLKHLKNNFNWKPRIDFVVFLFYKEIKLQNDFSYYLKIAIPNIAKLLLYHKKICGWTHFG
jgi:hypothetical protein